MVRARMNIELYLTHSLEARIAEPSPGKSCYRNVGFGGPTDAADQEIMESDLPLDRSPQPGPRESVAPT
jgi:hypothetical protein